MSLEWAEKIRGLRESLDLTQTQFGELIGLSESQVYLWEKGTQEPTLCWQRIMQFLHDCMSNAIRILNRRPWLEGDGTWGDRIRRVLQSIDWSYEQLAVFLGTTSASVCEWSNNQTVPHTCYQILISFLEIYSSVDQQEWPPGLYFEPKDIISEERVRLLRLSLGMKQSQLANVLHVHSATVSGWEKGSSAVSWCTNLLLRIIEKSPRAVDLFERIPWGDQEVSSGRAREIRGLLKLSRMELAHFFGSTEQSVARYEQEGVGDKGCAILVYLLLEKYPEEFISFIEGLSSPGGQACPIW